MNIQERAYYFDITPQAVSTATTSVITVDCYLHELYLSNIGTATASVQVYDGSGFALLPIAPVAPNGVISINSHVGVSMPGGIVWFATSSNIHAHGNGRYKSL